jgi:hypothetical protein
MIKHVDGALRANTVPRFIEKNVYQLIPNVDRVFDRVLVLADVGDATNLRRIMKLAAPKPLSVCIGFCGTKLMRMEAGPFDLNPQVLHQYAAPLFPGQLLPSSIQPGLPTHLSMILHDEIGFGPNMAGDLLLARLDRATRELEPTLEPTFRFITDNPVGAADSIYFEVRIIATTKRFFGIGLQVYRPDPGEHALLPEVHAGWKGVGFFASHKLYHLRFPNTPWSFPELEQGDVVGVGWSRNTGATFFTLNGCFLSS